MILLALTPLYSTASWIYLTNRKGGFLQLVLRCRQSFASELS